MPLMVSMTQNPRRALLAILLASRGRSSRTHHFSGRTEQPGLLLVMRHRGEAREKRIAQFEKIAQESSSPPPESSTWDEKYQRFELPTWDEQYQRFELLLRHDFHGEPRSAERP